MEFFRNAAQTALYLALTMSLAAAIADPKSGLADEHFVYSVFRPLDLGEAGEETPKDFYVNMGTTNGLRPGAVLEVLRKVATYDLGSQKLYKDVILPVAKIKVIHVESNASIARLEKLAPVGLTPGLTHRAIMVGDLVRPAH